MNEQKRKFWPQLTAPSGNRGPGHDWNLNPGTLSEVKCHCPGRSGAEVPFTTPYYKWPSSKALPSKPEPPALPQTNPPPLPHKSLTEPQIGETDLSFVSSLLAWLLCHKDFSLCKRVLPRYLVFLCSAGHEPIRSLQQQSRGLEHRQPGAWPRIQFLSHAEPKHQAA